MGRGWPKGWPLFFVLSYQRKPKGLYGHRGYLCNRRGIGGNVAYLFRIIVLWALSSAAWAVIPTATFYNAYRGSPYESGTDFFPSQQAAITSWCAWYEPAIAPAGSDCQYDGFPNWYRYLWYGSVVRDQLYFSTKAQCPDHSTLVPGTNDCKCDTGYVQTEDGQSCRLPPDKCEFLQGKDFGGDAWIDMGLLTREQMHAVVGTKDQFCPPEACEAEGMVEGCGRNATTGRTFCDYTGVKYTGKSCTPKGDDEPPEPPGDDDPDPDNKPPAPCPKGKCMGTANGVEMCVPCFETVDGPDPSKPPPPDAPPPDPNNPTKPGGSNSNTTTTSQDNGDGTTTTVTTTTGSSTSCVGPNCKTRTTTTTTTSTTDNATGSRTKPDTITTETSEKEESKDSFCKENPKSWVCKEQNDSSFGGSCGAGFQCEGDAIQCAMARDQLERNCRLLDDNNMEGVSEYHAGKGKEGNQTGDLPGNESLSIGPASINQDALIGGGGLQDVSLSMAGHSLVLPLSKLAPYIGWMGNLAVAIAFIVAIRIVTR